MKTAFYLILLLVLAPQAFADEVKKDPPPKNYLVTLDVFSNLKPDLPAAAIPKEKMIALESVKKNMPSIQEIYPVLQQQLLLKGGGSTEVSTVLSKEAKKFLPFVEDMDPAQLTFSINGIQENPGRGSVEVKRMMFGAEIPMEQSSFMNAEGVKTSRVSREDMGWVVTSLDLKLNQPTLVSVWPILTHQTYLLLVVEIKEAQ